jgi:hypothetical protein
MRLSSRVTTSKYEDFTLRLSLVRLLRTEPSLIIELLRPDPTHHSQLGEGGKASLFAAIGGGIG